MHSSHNNRSNENTKISETHGDGVWLVIRATPLRVSEQVGTLHEYDRFLSDVKEDFTLLSWEVGVVAAHTDVEDFGANGLGQVIPAVREDLQCC